jgi:hypothetical protein
LHYLSFKLKNGIKKYKLFEVASGDTNPSFSPFCIYVLHAFQKKSPKGIKTAPKDVDLIKKRYQAAVEQSKENQ